MMVVYFQTICITLILCDGHLFSNDFELLWLWFNLKQIHINMMVVYFDMTSYYFDWMYGKLF